MNKNLLGDAKMRHTLEVFEYIKQLRRLIQFLDHMDFQEIKLDRFDKTVGSESSSGDSFEFFNIGIEPDRLAEIQLLANFF